MSNVNKHQPTKAELAASPIAGGDADALTGPAAAPSVSTSELDALRRQIAELAAAQQHAEQRARERDSHAKELERQLEQLTSGGDIDLVALDAKWRNREEARRRIYQAVAGKKVIILFHPNADQNRNFPVHLCLNGKYYNVPRGKPFEIEGEFLEVIDHAMVNHVAPEVTPDGDRKWTVYDSLTYPYTVIRGLEGCNQDDLLRASAA